MTELRERIARAMANEIGDGFDDAFSGKKEWIDCRGDKGGRYRDINEPMQCDYLAAADAALAEIAAAGLVLVRKRRRLPSGHRVRSRGCKQAILDAVMSSGADGISTKDVEKYVDVLIPTTRPGTVSSVLSRLKADGALTFDGWRYRAMLSAAPSGTKPPADPI